MFDVKVAYIPIGRKTFDMESAEQKMAGTRDLLGSLSSDIHAPDAIVSSPEELDAFLSERMPRDPDFIVFQLTTFADAQFIRRVMQDYMQPVFVWSVREPQVGGRLRLNSLTGGNSTCHALAEDRRDFDFIFGDPAEESVRRTLSAKFAAKQTQKKLSQLVVGVVGEHPPGFYFSDVDEDELKRVVGAHVHHFDLKAMFDRSLALPEAEWLPMLEQASAKVVGLNKQEESVIKFARFSTCLKQEATERQIAATAVRCWPEFFAEFGAAACSTLSQLIEDGIVASCESDINGAITMFIQRELSGGASPYLGDLVHMDEDENSVVFWHCGAGAYSLAHPSTGARAGVQPNRKMGFAMDFGLKPGNVTISRLSRSADGYRMLIMRGEALDAPQKFHGTSVTVRMPGSVRDTVQSLMLGGFEPHYSVVYADIAEELKELCRLLRLETVIYG